MKRWLFISLVLSLLFAVSFAGTLALIRGSKGVLSEGTEISVPSGQTLWFLDRSAGIAGDAGKAGEGLTQRFRFVAPDIGGGDDAPGFDDINSDMDHLCETVRVILEKEGVDSPAQIVITLADQATEVGSVDPEVTKYFAAYHLSDDRCVPEVF